MMSLNVGKWGSLFGENLSCEAQLTENLHIRFKSKFV
jgi:hypothetical protein